MAAAPRVLCQPGGLESGVSASEPRAVLPATGSCGLADSGEQSGGLADAQRGFAGPKFQVIDALRTSAPRILDLASSDRTRSAPASGQT